jgi:hypothetical protein
VESNENNTLVEMGIVDSWHIKELGLRAFKLTHLPEVCRTGEFPVVDRTLGLIILINGAHKEFTAILGRFHSRNAAISSFVERDEFIDYFLKSHGYF